MTRNSPKSIAAIRLASVLIAATAALAACSSTASIPDTRPAPSGEPQGDVSITIPDTGVTAMTGAEIRARFEGNRIEGCYVDGSRLSETLRADGVVLDNLAGRTTGTWRIDGDHLCFTHPSEDPEQPGDVEACFRAVQTKTSVDFYSVDTSAPVATTDCTKTQAGQS